MSLAPQELENSASKYAAEAIRLDSEGSNGQAISAYQRAVEALVKLVQIYPDYKLNKIYMERAGSYQNRIKALQMSNPLYDSDTKKLQTHQIRYLTTCNQQRKGTTRTEDAACTSKNF